MMIGVLYVVLLGLICHARTETPVTPPCHECEANSTGDTESEAYGQIRSHCSYPCNCPSSGTIKCPPGVSVVRDGCGCCEVCARQRGEPCDGNALCDPRKGLVCEFPADYPNTPGVCEVIKGLPCTVHNKTYNNGETFLLDCRTQCSCQNGTYACASLCPQENISPRGVSCLHPRLVEVPGQCCREWMCDSSAAEKPPALCNKRFSGWSECSSRCGLGISTRVVSDSENDADQTELYASSERECGAPGGTEARLCQEKPCEPNGTSPLPQKQYPMPTFARHHHVRKGHECRATHRSPAPMRLRLGPCISRKRFRPRWCGSCPGACCRPVATHTIRVLFTCDTRRGRPVPEGETSAEAEQLVGGWGGRWLPSPPQSLLSLAPPGTDMWEQDSHKSTAGMKMSSAQVQESRETASIFGHSRRKRRTKLMSKDEAGGMELWAIKPNLPKETRQTKRRRPDVRRGGRQGSGRGRRSAFDWSHESANEEELVTLSVQWIEKCKCFDKCPENLDHENEGMVTISTEEEDGDGSWDGDYKVVNGMGEMILRRVHREMKPQA